METPPSTDSLSRTLADWRVRPPADPAFRTAVWQRIRTRTQESWAAYVRAHRLGWSVAAVLAVTGAGWTGHAAAQARLQQQRDAMIVSYLVDLDPRVQARLQP